MENNNIVVARMKTEIYNFYYPVWNPRHFVFQQALYTSLVPILEVPNVECLCCEIYNLQPVRSHEEPSGCKVNFPALELTHQACKGTVLSFCPAVIIDYTQFQTENN